MVKTNVYLSTEALSTNIFFDEFLESFNDVCINLKFANLNMQTLHKKKTKIK